jgi:hypothetical protein
VLPSRTYFSKTCHVSFDIDPFSGKSVRGYSNSAIVDTEHKVKSYARSEYGLRALQRTNFHLITRASAQGILFWETATDAGATGVEMFVEGHINTFNARKEVIANSGEILGIIQV